MAYTGAGVYAPNEGPVDVGRIVEIIRTPVGDGCCVLLDHQAGKNQALQKIREACPDAIIQIRRYVKDWTAETPRDAAYRFVEVMDKCRQWTTAGTWANEQDLAAESAGQIGAAEGRLITWREWVVIAEWNQQVILEVQRIAPWIVLHYPGAAYGHGEDWGYDEHDQPLPGFPVVDGVPTPAYELLRPGIDLCPILNHHPYVQKGAPVKDEWRGVRRIEKTISLFPGKSIFVAETGDFDVLGGHAPDRIVEIAYYLQGLEAVLGYCFFILDSPDPGHRDNNWSNNRAIEAAYQRMTRVPRPRAWSTTATSTTPSPPPISDGPSEAKTGPQTTPSTSTTPSPASPGGSSVTDWYPAATQRPIAVNFTAGRGGRVPTVLVDHIADGLGSPFGWFNTERGDRGSSAHFWVSRAGLVEQYRPLGDTCWANGIVDEPDLTNAAVTAIVTEPVNPNRVSVAIEHEGKPGDTFPLVQVLASRRLHAWLAQQYTIPLNRARVLGHYQFDSVTRANCPGPTFPWAQILAKEAPMPDTVDQLRDQTFTLADQLQALDPKWKALGWPSMAAGVSANAEAIKSLVRASKHEK